MTETGGFQVGLRIKARWSILTTVQQFWKVFVKLWSLAFWLVKTIGNMKMS